MARAAGPGADTARPRAFVAFAGGGARGIAHVGALSALQSREVDVAGYAGTSAGALVATLAAAGYRADQILHPTEPTSLLSDLNRLDPRIRFATDLFGPGGWARIAVVRGLTRLVAVAGFWPTVAGTLLLISLAVGLCLALDGYRALVWAGATALAIAALMISGALLGLARLHTLRQAVAKLLADKLNKTGGPVTFADFDGKARPALKIVAANLTLRRLELFSSDTTPDVAVADAVAASICLPVIFDLWTIRGHRYVDGGIVSNLPAWPFDEERAADPAAMTVAFDIGKPDEHPHRRAKRLSRLGWVLPLMQTALSGSAPLNLRAIGPTELITLRPRIKLMDFDVGSKDAREVLRNTTAAARAEIDRRLFTYPDAYRLACRNVVELTQRTLERAPHVLHAAPAIGRIRAATAFMPEDYFHTVRLRYGWNFVDDTDQDITLPLDGSLVGVAWREGEPQFDIAPFPDDLSLLGPHRNALRRLLWKDLAWSLRVPICGDKGTVLCVVAVDGADRLVDTPDTQEVFEGLTDEIVAIFAPVLTALKDVDFADGTVELPNPF